MMTIVIGVMPQEQIRARAIAIAKGEYTPKPGEPRIWFTSMKSMAEVLSDQNRALLEVIRETNPDSMAVLAKATAGRSGPARSFVESYAIRRISMETLNRTARAAPRRQQYGRKSVAGQ
jgi:hypothetical protein